MDDLFLPSEEVGYCLTVDTTDELPVDPKVAASIITETSKGNVVLVLDSHGHAQLERDEDKCYTMKGDEGSSSIVLKSITCAVAPQDWSTTLDYSSKSESILPALGVHPWYIENLYHGWLEELERLLILHPSALVGEIGLCKMAHFVRQHPEGKSVALGIQRDVFKVSLILHFRACLPFYLTNYSFFRMTETNDSCCQAEKTSVCALCKST
jgi:TatD DNase family protein